MELFSETFQRTPGGITRTVSAGSLRGVSSVACGDIDANSPLSHQWWAQQLRGTPTEIERVGAIHTVDFFCGSGGLSVGAARAIEACGMNHVPLAAVDVDAEALGVYSRNFKPQAALATNAASVVDYHIYGRGEDAELAYEPELVDGRLEALVGKVDLVLAGPPCQGHSNLNNHTRRSDPRNMLYVSVAAAAIALRTRALVIENVPDVLADKTNVVGAASKILRQAGYCVSTAVLSATELGAAQTRKRHFLIATKGRTAHVPVGEVAGLLRQPPMTLREIIQDLAIAPHRSFMDDAPVLSPENRSRIDYLFEHDLYELPDLQRPDCHKNGHTYPSVYGRLSWDKPSQTITTGFMTPGRGRYIHPSQRRVLTAREAARIQGFPDTYDFTVDGTAPSKKALTKWIGDAVPCWLGYAAVLAALTGY
ncbi:DNA (cytosine-5-)-methyltransferase [Massilia eurypsychrophila]|uniref:DNA (cytosine-5-)-methyltransferase n=1 Tax=Massilia eurypsychrophila TaxID=1485217 RepID=A0A2G8TM07_9BURK|nr:DNA cytosine methyltransferase [Massilia eurypsychrophila]PIL46638.1 DNA (cytosine-5-)-methyltransferase [Massilia eurypsychrophila]